jgi:hypothetical protein
LCSLTLTICHIMGFFIATGPINSWSCEEQQYQAGHFDYVYHGYTSRPITDF